MADFQQQLQAILGDPEAMGQISALARSLTGGVQEQTADSKAAETAPEPPPQESPPDLSTLLSALSNEGMPEPDPRLLGLALELLKEYQAPDDEKAALLAALRPFLRPERQEKLDQAVRLARLARTARSALRLLREEGAGNV